VPHSTLELVEYRFRGLFWCQVGGDPAFVAVALAQFAEAEVVWAIGRDRPLRRFARKPLQQQAFGTLRTNEIRFPP